MHGSAQSRNAPRRMAMVPAGLLLGLFLSAYVPISIVIVIVIVIALM